MHPLRHHVMALALAAGASIAGPALAASDANLPVVRIGLSAPLTSAPMAGVGADARDAAQLAVDELNAQGVRIGKANVKLELVAVDDHSDPVAAPAAARELVAAHVAGVVGPMSSGTALKAASLYAQAGLPMLTPSATHPGLTRLGLPSVFRLQPDDAALAQRLVAWAARERRLRLAARVEMERADEAVAQRHPANVPDGAIALFTYDDEQRVWLSPLP